MTQEKVIGILGGMGPEATADLFMEITRHTEAQTDQDHFRILVDSNAKIPSRQAAVLEGGPDPTSALVATARALEQAGADFLVSMIAFQPETYRRYPGIAIIPGVESPNEAKLHVDWGASLVKFSGPALRGGPAYFKSMVVCGPLHRGLPVLVTGGVKPELIEPYVEAGVLAAAAGFDLILGQAYKEFQKRPTGRWFGTRWARTSPPLRKPAPGTGPAWILRRRIPR